MTLKRIYKADILIENLKDIHLTCTALLHYFPLLFHQYFTHTLTNKHSPCRISTLRATKTRDPSRDTRTQRARFQHLHSLSTTRWPRMAAWLTICLQHTHSHSVSAFFARPPQSPELFVNTLLNALGCSGHFSTTTKQSVVFGLVQTSLIILLDCFIWWSLGLLILCCSGYWWEFEVRLGSSRRSYFSRSCNALHPLWTQVNCLQFSF